MRKLTDFIRNIYRKFILNYSSRQRLLDLDDDALRDIGVTYEQAQKEGKKPFWKGNHIY